MDIQEQKIDIEEYQKNIPIQLDNVCSTQGDITPRWFRFEDGDHVIHTIVVTQIISCKEINYVGIRMIQFVCKTTEENAPNMEWLVELRYNILTHRWFFFQRLT